LVFGLSLAAGSLPLLGQSAIPLGTWRTHSSYQQIKHVASTPERVYAAGENGLFSVSRSDGSLRILSKTDGFSEGGVVALAYEPASATLALAYRSGGIDVLSDGRITPFALLRRASEAETEMIYDLHWQGSTLFVSTSQGVRVLTLSEGALRIVASYTRLSATGDPLVIYQATTSADSIYLATDEGVIANTLATTTNQQDFSTWRRFATAGPSGRVRHVAYHKGALYAAYDGTGLFRRQSGRWQPTELATLLPLRALRPTEDALLAVTAEEVVTLRDGIVVSSITELAPQDAVLDEQGALWVGDQTQGLVRLSGGERATFLPNGPASDSVRVLRWLDDQLMALGASPSGVFSTFRQGQWATHRIPDLGAPLLDATFDPAGGSYYLASFGQGLWRWDGAQSFSSIPPPAGVARQELTALALQADRLWVGRYAETNSLHAYSLTESRWQSSANSIPSAVYPRQLALDFGGTLWMLAGNVASVDLPGSDVLALGESKGVQSVRQSVGVDDLPGRSVTDLVVDRNGLVWISGNQGIAYLPNPARVFTGVVLVKPIFERQFLLRDEYVTCLAVDGGNRKWVGTRNGLWVFSETGEELVERFTAENSPLISDVILDIAINPLDGEVFVTTDRGLVSYRGGATEGGGAHQSVAVFPNPVRRSRDETVGIRGLAQDAVVKITTVSGALVRELRAQGGTATWDGRNQAGQAVSVGVYLLFSASPDGEETYVGKLAVTP
jgi:ligand-binding sensor domain-containing protein